MNISDIAMAIPQAIPIGTHGVANPLSNIQSCICREFGNPVTKAVPKAMAAPFGVNTEDKNVEESPGSIAIDFSMAIAPPVVCALKKTQPTTTQPIVSR